MMIAVLASTSCHTYHLSVKSPPFLPYHTISPLYLFLFSPFLSKSFISKPLQWLSPPQHPTPESSPSYTWEICAH
ncbi:hypothetical protein NC651_006604 [Populus alba x Populus x berolinensis]|nr:hypothetical protein NC651_006604 [Populus alba x Populus x berolinensis]